MKRYFIVPALLLNLGALCSCATLPTAERGFVVQTDQPMSLEWATEGQDLANLYFAGLMACSNHDPAHTAETFEDMEELSQEPPGCVGWRFVGALADNPQVLYELGPLRVNTSVFDEH